MAPRGLYRASEAEAHRQATVAIREHHLYMLETGRGADRDANAGAITLTIARAGEYNPRVIGTTDVHRAGSPDLGGLVVTLPHHPVLPDAWAPAATQGPTEPHVYAMPQLIAMLIMRHRNHRTVKLCLPPSRPSPAFRKRSMLAEAVVLEDVLVASRAFAFSVSNTPDPTPLSFFRVCVHISHLRHGTAASYLLTKPNDILYHGSGSPTSAACGAPPHPRTRASFGRTENRFTLSWARAILSRACSQSIPQIMSRLHLEDGDDRLFLARPPRSTHATPRVSVAPLPQWQNHAARGPFHCCAPTPRSGLVELEEQSLTGADYPVACPLRNARPPDIRPEELPAIEQPVTRAEMSTHSTSAFVCVYAVGLPLGPLDFPAAADV
ncbi:hypothetical protein EVG20_g10732 [Dentipellis fragilis]|uniref:Uncharacterized protein n=1 Tax=Dentipellis fragilis TaxID=205917 RepID=A0A4Y9XQJ8_9AGAM|nr:hypothetical protein EVG20_g10732 [Dentipellis fragilis]